jgi:hypothetical protein
MSQGDDIQVQQFSDELDKMIDRFREEYDLSYAAIVGALQFKQFCLMCECQNVKSEDDEPDEDP